MHFLEVVRGKSQIRAEPPLTQQPRRDRRVACIAQEYGIAAPRQVVEANEPPLVPFRIAEEGAERSVRSALDFHIEGECFVDRLDVARVAGCTVPAARQHNGHAASRVDPLPHDRFPVTSEPPRELVRGGQVKRQRIPDDTYVSRPRADAGLPAIARLSEFESAANLRPEVPLRLPEANKDVSCAPVFVATAMWARSKVIEMRIIESSSGA